MTVPAIGETYYLSGEVALPAITAAANTPQAYGDTETQAMSVLRKVEQTLKCRG